MYLHFKELYYTPYTALLYLRNGLTDCVQIWYVGWGSLTKCLPQVIGGVHPSLLPPALLDTPLHPALLEGGYTVELKTYNSLRFL